MPEPAPKPEPTPVRNTQGYPQMLTPIAEGGWPGGLTYSRNSAPPTL